MDKRKIIFLDSIAYRNKAVSNHPQFKHIRFAPEGYAFVYADKLEEEKLRIASKLVWGGELTEEDEKNYEKIEARRKVIEEEKDKLIGWCKEQDIPEEIYIRYLRVVDLGRRSDQIPLGKELMFLPSYLFSLQQSPFVIEIESIWTLFYPYILQSDCKDAVVNSGRIFQLISYLLKRRECTCILTHMKLTENCLKKNFDKDIADKVRYVSLGVPKANVLCNTYQKPYGEKIRLLFTCSWHQFGFENRGGLELLTAFDSLCRKYGNLELTMKCSLPQNLHASFHGILDRHKDKIHVITGKLPDQEMDVLMQNTDIFVLPAMDMHIISILNTMAMGIPLVVGDALGVEEYVEDNVNGVIVRGRKGKSSWLDEDGIERYDYDVGGAGDAEFAENLAARLEELISDNEFRYRITRNAYNDANEKYSVERMNRELKKVFDDCYQAIV